VRQSGQLCSQPEASEHHAGRILSHGP
jgi:hypothetical protein